MSLRTRILALISAVLAISITLGAVGAGLQVRKALREEVQAAMQGGAQTVRSAFEDLPRSDHPTRDLHQLLATFDGNRHLVASLIDGSGPVVAASRQPELEQAAPRWFARLITPPSTHAAFVVPASIVPATAIPAGAVSTTPGGVRLLALRAAPDADVAATWAELSTIVLVLGLSALVGLSLVYLLIQAALAPLHDLSDSFVRIGRGDYRERVRERGPVEILRLERSFNEMTERLTAMSETNRRLEAQLLTLQDEERAELARDLHDDIGPHLFAVSLDAEMIAQVVKAGRPHDVFSQVDSIQSTVGRVQREIRQIVARLRPAQVTELGLNRAVQDLVRFWQARRPEITFRAELLEAEQGLTDPVKDTAFRVVQEAVNNAIRHASPTWVEVRLAWQDGELTLRISNDGASQALTEPMKGFGLIGMHERIGSVGGDLAIATPTLKDATWRVTASLPAAPMPSASGVAWA